jgi:hypothetical protein
VHTQPAVASCRNVSLGIRHPDSVCRLYMSTSVHFGCQSHTASSYEPEPGQRHRPHKGIWPRTMAALCECHPNMTRTSRCRGLTASALTHWLCTCRPGAVVARHLCSHPSGQPAFASQAGPCAPRRACARSASSVSDAASAAWCMSPHAPPDARAWLHESAPVRRTPSRVRTARRRYVARGACQQRQRR